MPAGVCIAGSVGREKPATLQRGSVNFLATAFFTRTETNCMRRCVWAEASSSHPFCRGTRMQLLEAEFRRSRRLLTIGQPRIGM
jgi:hypothetical protein